MKKQQVELSAHAMALQRTLQRYEDSWKPPPKWLMTREGIKEITGKYINKEQVDMSNSLRESFLGDKELLKSYVKDGIRSLKDNISNVLEKRSLLVFQTCRRSL